MPAARGRVTEDLANFPTLVTPKALPDRADRVFKAGALTFRADFCSANLASARHVIKNEYEVSTFADNDGTPQQTGHRSWFYFGVTGHSEGEIIVITVTNMNKQATLYAGGYRVHHRSPAMPEFRQIRTRVRYTKGEQSSLRFSHRFDAAGETFFAFCIPWSCEDNARLLASLDARWCACAAPPARPGTGADELAAGVHEGRKGDASDDEIYYARQRLAVTLRGRPVDLLTITDMHGANDGTDSEEPAWPPVFSGKRVVFVSARVHPGETPASHLLNGMLLLLLRRRDPRAAALRRRFVFKIVPMVNPDGVALGHFRVDTLAQNLNRFYSDADPAKQPAVFAISRLLASTAAAGRLAYYLDLHAHANKRGVFAYGNALEGGAHVDALRFCKLAALNSPHFDFGACNFTERNMCARDRDGTTKGGTGRVAIYRQTALPHLYTIEANYHGASHGASHGAPGGAAFDVQAFHQAGRALLVTILDMEGGNPRSCVPASPYRNMAGVREWLIASIKMASSARLSDFPACSERSLESVRALPEAKTLVPSKVLARLRKSTAPAQGQDGLKARRRAASCVGSAPAARSSGGMRNGTGAAQVSSKGPARNGVTQPEAAGLGARDRTEGEAHRPAAKGSVASGSPGRRDADTCRHGSITSASRLMLEEADLLLLDLAAAARHQACGDREASVSRCSGAADGACDSTGAPPARMSPTPTQRPERPHSCSPGPPVQHLELEEHVAEDREGGCFGAWAPSRPGALQRRSSRGRTAQALARAPSAPRAASARRPGQKSTGKAACAAGGAPLLWGTAHPRARTLTWSGRRVDEFERAAVVRKSTPLGARDVAALVGRVLQSAGEAAHAATGPGR